MPSPLARATGYKAGPLSSSPPNKELPVYKFACTREAFFLSKTNGLGKLLAYHLKGLGTSLD